MFESEKLAQKMRPTPLELLISWLDIPTGVYIRHQIDSDELVLDQSPRYVIRYFRWR